MKKFYCNGKKGFCDFVDEEEIPNCHLYDCKYFDDSGGDLVEVKEAESEGGQ